MTLQAEAQAWARHPIARSLRAERIATGAPSADLSGQNVIFVNGRSDAGRPGHGGGTPIRWATHPRCDPRVPPGNFYALGGPGDLAPLATSTRIAAGAMSP